MDDKNKQIVDGIENLSLKICMLEAGDIPAMGDMLNILSELKEVTPDIDNAALTDVIDGLKDYLGQLILNETENIKPLEAGVTALQAIWRNISRGEDLTFDISSVLQELGAGSQQNKQPFDSDTDTDNATISDRTEKEIKTDVKLSEEDLQILSDFVAESRENLEVIEFKLIELEQVPGDKEIINAVFRPFHTIKGVSGFLGLDKINVLCHNVENLIDSARTGSIIINNEIADIILESVDTLKLMMEEVEKSIQAGISTQFEDIDVSRLVEKIQSFADDTNEKTVSIGKILVEDGRLDKKDLRDSLRVQKKNPDKKIGEILSDENKVTPEDIRSALNTQAKVKQVGIQVKVDTEKLDNLVDLTGELVIAQSMFKQFRMASDGDNQKYAQQLNQVTQTVSSIQKIAMSMRMIPIKNTFQKMFRLVRDLSKNSGKKVALHTLGVETEIDRNVVDELYEPMVHMIRNSIDHGLEIPSEREAAGKTAKGSIYLRAFQKGGNIVIEIEDDGRGLDKNRILQKAIERNLTTGEDPLSDKEIFDFIMHPGFSTAEKVTDISGRGVGMDVVKEAIMKLRGRLTINSALGKGTVFTIYLPLTMAIVEGMLVRVGLEKYIIPTHAILESFRPDKKDYYTVKEKGEMIHHRKNLIPLLRINRLFNVKADVAEPWKGITVVLENHGEQKALLVDELLGKEEFVIKNLSDMFKSVEALAGSAILADGKVGLILDMAGLFKSAVQ